ncbi:MerR family transcriptional regulator [Allokutzneria sp. NRRL B-24872]|uniref:MerR family transcriptional regulator n=1 Tax=Allokutzneria sp. NRRL B-24872 TaxID=1137961 RepID=UPI000A3C4F6F|nr:MerR family transcriptional regulator [Allokutzneria sp. NRRL B-24872]
MTHDTTLSIGELAQLTGIPVRTIRFYCDNSLLDVARSAGGHRRFARSSVQRLSTVRQLRAFGLGLTTIEEVLAGQRSLSEAVAAERRTVDRELALLSWRRASLRAVEDAAPDERAARIGLLAAVQDDTAAREALVSFWHNAYLVRAPVDTVEMFLSVSAPLAPIEPTPAQVLAYAGMVQVVRDASLRQRLAARVVVADQRTLHEGVGEACELARPLVAAGERPRAGPALDRFVVAHAEALRERDTPAFRRRLLAETEAERDPRLRRYWRLVGTLTGEEVTAGEAHAWLLDAL